jgi:hypothetical protein
MLVNKFLEKHYNWCFKALEDPDYAKSEAFKKKKKEARIRGLIILSSGFLLYQISLPIIPHVFILYLLHLVVFFGVIMGAGLYEFFTGIIGFPPPRLPLGG